MAHRPSTGTRTPGAEPRKDFGPGAPAFPPLPAPPGTCDDPGEGE